MSQLFPFLFQNCLGIIYTVFIENLQFSLESIIGNILGCVHIPPPGKFFIFILNHLICVFFFYINVHLIQVLRTTQGRSVTVKMVIMNEV